MYFNVIQMTYFSATARVLINNISTVAYLLIIRFLFI